MHRGKGIAAAAVAALVLLLLLWGSGSGTQVLSPPSGEANTGAAPSLTRQPDTGDVTVATSAPNVLEPATPALDWLMIFFALVVLAILIQVVKWLLNRDWEESEAPEDDELVDELDLLLEATSPTARTAALAEGEPRNVVVRCWVALEDAAAASGLERDVAETSAEFTRRFLGTWEVEEATTQELAELYREARFSRHEVTHEVGARAVELVGTVHDQLRASSARRGEATDDQGASVPDRSTASVEGESR